MRRWKLWALALAWSSGTPAALAAAFDVSQLNADLRGAVLAARAAEKAANAVDGPAHAAAVQGEEAARRARQGQAGYDTYDDSSKYHYECEYRNSGCDGYGITTTPLSDPKYGGDIYEGQWVGGHYNGLGVYTFGDNPNNASTLTASTSGQFAEDAPNGYAVVRWKNAARYAGDVHVWKKDGSGVLHYANGNRYEGSWASDQRNGYGVVWSSSGAISQAGLWTDGKLTTPIGPQGP